MAHVWGRKRLGREPANRDDPAPRSELLEKRARGPYLRPARPAVRGGSPRMGRNDVPEQNLVEDAEFREDAVHDRRSGLGKPAACQLPLRSERDTADPRAAV